MVEWERHIEFGVALVALLLGIWHLFEIRSQGKQLESQKKQLDSQAEISEGHKDLILGRLSTRRLGQFPEYIAPITEAIEKARREVVILCDFPAYGSFSVPHDFLRYRQALERKIDEGKTVRITCLDSSSRLKLTHEQFSREKEDWVNWKGRLENIERLKVFFHYHGRKLDILDLSITQFAALLEEEDVHCLNDSLAHADKALISAHIPLYFWLIDDEVAVFAIPSFTEKATEHGFFTMDQHLIVGLQDLEARYRRTIRLASQLDNSG